MQLPLLAWTLASAGCRLMWSHGLFARQDLLGGLVLGSLCTYALLRLVTLLGQVCGPLLYAAVAFGDSAPLSGSTNHCRQQLGRLF